MSREALCDLPVSYESLRSEEKSEETPGTRTLLAEVQEGARLSTSHRLPTVALPRPAWGQRHPVPAMRTEAQVRPEAALHVSQQSTLPQPIHVLLVEDSRAYALLLRKSLAQITSAVFQVTWVERLSRALQHLAFDQVDVILLDLSLPDSLGLETFITLYAHVPHIPIVVLSGVDDETIAIEAVYAGAQDYLVKGQVESVLLGRAIRYAIERKRAQEALRQQRAWLDATLSSIGDAVIATDTAGMITFVNAMAARLTGWEPEEALGCPIDTVFRIRQERPLYVVDNPVTRTLQEKTAIEVPHQTILMARGGREFPIADSTASIRSGDGTLYGVVVVFRDISKLQRLEEQLRQVHKMEAIGTLAGGVAHDFNNILTAVLGYTELAIYDLPPASLSAHHLRHVLTAGKRARDLVQQILAFSRQTTTAPRPVQLHLLIKEALTLLRASLPSTIDIRSHLVTDAGTVLADPTQMHQVLMNLCANAEHAMRETGGVLEVRLDAIEVDAMRAALIPRLQPGPYIRLVVQDTGPGMPPEVLARAFEPFFTTKDAGEGTGMGLAVVHGIITNHGGTITVSSASGRGATFEIYLPRSTAAEPCDTPSEAALPRGMGRVLLIDDEPAVARMGQDLLTRLGYDVVTYLTGIEALQAFRAAPQRFDLVITDQTMPHMTGDVLVQLLRRLRPELPIILCTGFSYTMNAEKAKLLGVNVLLPKPWDARGLAQAVQQALAQ